MAGGPNQRTLNVNSAALNATNISGGTLTVDAVGMGSVGTLSNIGTITGALTISNGTTNNAGAVTGAMTISDGMLSINTGSNLADGQPFTVNTGVVNVNAADTVGTLSGIGGSINFGAGGQLNVDQAGNATFAGGVSGATATDVINFK